MKCSFSPPLSVPFVLNETRFVVQFVKYRYLITLEVSGRSVNGKTFTFLTSSSRFVNHSLLHLKFEGILNVREVRKSVCHTGDI